MFTVSHDGFTYETNDPLFADGIRKGYAEPYPRDLAIVERYLRAFPNRSRTYIDAGAHIGSTIAPYSRLFKTVIGFEPMPESFQFLTANMKRNGIPCRLEPCALYDEECRAGIFKHAGGNSGCYAIWKSEEGPIQCKPLDSYNIPDVDFLKIDVQGAELYVLRGAETTLRTFKPLIQLECTGWCERLYGVTRRDIEEFLASLGYCLYADEGANLFFHVPRIEDPQIVCYWGAAPITDRRKETLRAMVETTGCTVRLLTPETFRSIAIPASPLHPAFPYLSDVHQADYVRTYMMHHFGGGYSDIKPQTGSWRSAFETLGDAWISGYHEECEGAIACPEVRHAWADLPGNCAYICKPRTPLTEAWFGRMHALLDERLEALRQHPATSPRDCAEHGGGYPLEWNEMLGRIFHKVCYDFRDKVAFDVPIVKFTNYM